MKCPVCTQITGNTIETRGGAINVGGLDILTSSPVQTNITISNNYITGTQYNTLSVWAASQVWLRV